MQGQPPIEGSTPTGAVFLSYASQDAEAARKICEALRAAGIEVWFDQSELRGGDVWDQKIRREIHDCALFVPIISANTAARQEGYFRLEWDLADQRTHMLARDRPFIVPVCLDAMPGAGTDVPQSFHRVQWTRFSGGQTPPAFVELVRRLVSTQPSHGPTGTPLATPLSGVRAMSELLPAPGWSKRTLPAITAVVVAGALAYFIIAKFWVSNRPVSPTTLPAAPANATPTAFAPPPHSVAVLPFVNMSADKEQEYFSDGLTEEILNSLVRITELQVSARTSAFAFKGKDVKIGTIARELNVGSILEGSVRRSGHTIRVTAQLNNAVTGFHLWSQTYDRDLSDVLRLQTEIANAVANALKVTLLGDVGAKIELGGTRNPTALDSYLQASKAYSAAHNTGDLNSAVAAYSEAIHQDPRFALAFAGRSEALNRDASEWLSAAAAREQHGKALADARQAIVLAPGLAEAHRALGSVLEEGFLDFGQAATEYTRAMELAPGDAHALQSYGSLAVNMGRTESGLAAIRHAIALDPLNTRIRSRLGEAYWSTRQYDQALTVFNEVIALDPEWPRAHAWRGFAAYALGDFETARSGCEGRPANAWIPVCLALVYGKLGRRADAEAALAKNQVALGDAGSYQYAEIYTQWGNSAKAREWLATAVRVRDPALTWLKTDPFLDPLRNEPWFKEIERQLNFPN